VKELLLTKLLKLTKSLKKKMTFKRLSEYFQQLEGTSSRLKITEILSRLFKECSQEEIDKICYLSLGRLLPAYEGVEFQMAEKMLIRAIGKATGIDPEKVQKEYKKVGDLGEVGEKIKNEKLFGKVREIGVMGVYKRLMEIAKEGGEGSVERKIDKMAALIEDLDPLSVRYIVRIPLGKLRLGFSEMTILDSLSWMIAGNKSLREELEDAYNVLADVGEIAKRAKRDKGVKRVEPKVGTPIVPALAQRVGTVEEMLEKMGEKIALEPKYDGTRLQIHKGETEDRGDMGVRIFTRNLENVTHMFPDIVAALKKEVRAREVILDGEGIGIDPKTGKYLPFQETIKRKRKHLVGQMAKEIPFKCFVFDILYKDGKNLIKIPFSERREILEKIFSPEAETLALTPQIVTQEPREMRRFHNEQVKKGLEGAMVKKLDAPYDPGRRGFTWVKYKQEETKKGARHSAGPFS